MARYTREKKKHEYVIKLRTTERDFAESFAHALEKLGMRPRIDIEDRSKHNPGWKIQYVVRAFSKTFYEFYKSLSSKDIKELIKGYEPYFLRGFYESEGLCYEGKGTMSIRIYNSNLTLIDIAYEALTRLGFHVVIKDRGYPGG